MPSKELDNLVNVGTLKAEPGDQREFDGLLESGRKRMKDAGNIALAAESRFDLAYSAAHAFALAALCWHSYRPDRKRYVVFQALTHTLGLKPEIGRVLDKAHSLRNAAEYEGYFDVDDRLLIDLLKAIDIVHAAVEKLGPVPRSKSRSR
jgi:hypothetical protein